MLNPDLRSGVGRAPELISGVASVFCGFRSTSGDAGLAEELARLPLPDGYSAGGWGIPLRRAMT